MMTGEARCGARMVYNCHKEIEVLKLFVSGIVALLFPLAVAAQPVGGSYTVAGTNPDGAAYTGAAEITFEEGGL